VPSKNPARQSPLSHASLASAKAHSFEAEENMEPAVNNENLNNETLGDPKSLETIRLLSLIHNWSHHMRDRTAHSNWHQQTRNVQLTMTKGPVSRPAIRMY
jgi:hypothetical protein